MKTSLACILFISNCLVPILSISIFCFSDEDEMMVGLVNRVEWSVNDNVQYGTFFCKKTPILHPPFFVETKHIVAFK